MPAEKEEQEKDLPVINAEAPVYYYGLPEEQREERAVLTFDLCVIDHTHCFVKGQLQLPVTGRSKPLTFYAWVMLNVADFEKFDRLWDQPGREDLPVMFGRFSTWIHPFEGTENLQARVIPGKAGTLPIIQLEPGAHPLSKAQKEGISNEQLQQIFEYYLE